MAIDTAAILMGSTAFVAPTGGASNDLSIISRAGTKVVAHLDGATSFTTRKTVEFSAKDPVALESAPGGYTQAREKVVVKWPITLANGNRTVNTATIEIARDPEFTTANCVDLRLMLAQLLGDSDFTDFWNNHVLS